MIWFADWAEGFAFKSGIEGEVRDPLPAELIGLFVRGPKGPTDLAAGVTLGKTALEGAIEFTGELVVAGADQLSGDIEL